MKRPLYSSLICCLIAISSISLADDKSLYDFKWLDEGEKVYVIQNKEYVKAGRIGIDLSLIDSDSSPFQDTTGFVGSLTYYISETLSLDITYKQYNNEDSGDLSNLLNQIGDGVVPIIRKINTAALVHINWIPFYGKINTFNQIFFFDWGVGFGVGQFQTEGNWETFDQDVGLKYTTDQDTGFNLRSFAKFYTRNNLTFGIEYNLTGVDTIKDPQGKSAYLYFADIMASVGYIF
ncbi:MAG: hypothetical protein CME65_12480 [Halobacteriovoraceae bacterium]|nr:hypothetical protein [Halobacteriovoraceae bacterium]